MTDDPLNKKINDLNHKLTMAVVAPPIGKMRMELTEERGRQRAIQEMRLKFMQDLAAKNPKFKNVLESFAHLRELHLQKAKLMEEALWTKALIVAVRDEEESHDRS